MVCGDEAQASTSPSPLRQTASIEASCVPLATFKPVPSADFIFGVPEGSDVKSPDMPVADVMMVDALQLQQQPLLDQLSPPAAPAPPAAVVVPNLEEGVVGFEQLMDFANFDTDNLFDLCGDDGEPMDFNMEEYPELECEI
jgi:hypothetical protein